MEPGKEQSIPQQGSRKKFAAFSLRQLWRCEIVLVFLFAALLAIGFNSPRHNGLAKYKASLKARGEKLSLDELMPADISECQASQAQLAAAGFELGHLRLCPGALALMHYVAPGRAQSAWKQDRPPWDQNSGRDTVDSWQDYHARMTEASPILADVRCILKDPPPYWASLTSRRQGAIPNFVGLRLTAQWLAGETIDYLHHGRLEESLQDLEAIAGCAQVNRADFCMVSQMIRVAVSGLGLSASWEALQAPGWTEDQLARLQKAWEPVDLIEAVEKGVIGLRAESEEIWRRTGLMSGRRLRTSLAFPGATSTTARTLLSDYIQFPVYRLTSMDEDELFYLRCAQDSIERIRRIQRGQPWIESADGISLGTAELDGLNPLTAPFRHWISLKAMPNVTRAVQIAAQNETLRQLTLAAIAIKRFQLRHGHLPLNLAVLSPEFLDRPVFDPMSGGQLQLILRKDGHFILYSAGKDHRDDGGEAPFWFRRKPGMWEELDAVWPEPAAAEAPGNCPN